MEAMISELVKRFETGVLSRRELVQGLTLLAAGETAAIAQTPALKAVKVDHVSIQVSDLPRAAGFYQKVFGLIIVGEDKPNEIVRLGNAGKSVVSLHHKSPTGIVDHFALGVEGFNKETVTAKMKAMGIEATDNLDAGFHIIDPEGIPVQIMGA